MLNVQSYGKNTKTINIQSLQLSINTEDNLAVWSRWAYEAVTALFLAYIINIDSFLLV